MIPVMLDPSRLRIALAGRGPLAARRLAWFERLGTVPALFGTETGDEFGRAAESRLAPRLPDEADLSALDVLWIAGLEDDETASLVASAKALHLLVNVEDDLRYCDFHTPAVVKRGQLVLAAGTGGASPAAAAAVRSKLEAAFPEQWGDVLQEIAQARADLRTQGASMEEVAADARARLARSGLA